MSITLAVNPSNNDLFVKTSRVLVDGEWKTSRSLQMVYGAPEVQQRIRIALMHFYGEYFLNRQNGIPWYTDVLGSKNLGNVAVLFRSAIMKVPGVLKIEKFNVLYADRKLTLSITAQVEGANGPEILDLVTSAKDDGSRGIVLS